MISTDNRYMQWRTYKIHICQTHERRQLLLPKRRMELIYRNLLCFYNNERSEREIKETAPLTSTSKRIKYLGIKLPKEAKDLLHSENYKMLMKETEDDTNRWKDIPCSWNGRINIVKMTILSKAIYRFSASSVKLPMVFFREQIGRASCRERV